MLAAELTALKQRREERFGWVTKEWPLLSNLSVWQNIALIKQYHENWSSERSMQMSLELLTRLDLRFIAHQRVPQLTEEEIFFIKILRAAMLPQAEIMIDRPFRQAGESLLAGRLHKHLESISDHYGRCRIFDHASNARKYESFNERTVKERLENIPL